MCGDATGEKVGVPVTWGSSEMETSAGEVSECSTFLCASNFVFFVNFVKDKLMLNITSGIRDGRDVTHHHLTPRHQTKSCLQNQC